MTTWENVEVPAGSYIGWGAEPGQIVIGKVLAYNPTGGTDFAGSPCPELQLELLEPAYSMNKAGERFDYDKGQLVNINAGGANLKRGVTAAQPNSGDLIKIEFEKIEPLKGGKSVKCFKISIARGAGASTQAAPTTATTPAGGALTKPESFPQAAWDGLTDDAKAAVLAQQ